MKVRETIQWVFISFLARGCMEYDCGDWESILNATLPVLSFESKSGLRFLAKVMKYDYLKYLEWGWAEDYRNRQHPIEKISKEDFLRLLLIVC